ncbi:MAG: hypothetical protein ACKVS9_18335 [Phycisphaerae bacterium]
MTTTNANDRMTESNIAEHAIRSRLEGSMNEQANARAERIDWSTMKRLGRTQAQIDIYGTAVRHLDAGTPIAEVLASTIETLTDALLGNTHRPSSTCPFSNALEIEWCEVAAHSLRELKSLLRCVKREAERAA